MSDASENRRFIAVITTIFVVMMMLISLVSVILTRQLLVTPKDAYAISKKIEAHVEQINRSQQLQQLTEKESRVDRLLSETLSQSKDALVVADSAGIITLWSSGAEKLFKIRREYAIGFGLSFLIPPELRDKHRKAFEAAMKTSSTVPIRRTYVSEGLLPDGSRIPITLHLSVIPGAGAVALIERHTTASNKEKER